MRTSICRRCWTVCWAQGAGSPRKWARSDARHQRKPSPRPHGVTASSVDDRRRLKRQLAHSYPAELTSRHLPSASCPPRARGANPGSNSHLTRPEPPKDRLSAPSDPRNAARFGWQAWRAARARCLRSACRACPLDARLSAVRQPVMRLQPRQHCRNPTLGFPSPPSAVVQTQLPTSAAADLSAAAPGRDEPRTA